MQALAAANRILADQGRIRTMTFSPDGKTLATGDIHRTIKLWDVASREEILVLNGHGTTVEKVGFAEHGELLYSLGNGKPCELFLWPGRREAGTRSDPISMDH
jgi:WD40 repeat protein